MSLADIMRQFMNLADDEIVETHVKSNLLLEGEGNVYERFASWGKLTEDKKDCEDEKPWKPFEGDEAETGTPEVKNSLASVNESEKNVRGHLKNHFAHSEFDAKGGTGKVDHKAKAAEYLTKAKDAAKEHELDFDELHADEKKKYQRKLKQKQKTTESIDEAGEQHTVRYEYIVHENMKLALNVLKRDYGLEVTKEGHKELNRWLYRGATPRQAAELLRADLNKDQFVKPCEQETDEAYSMDGLLNL